MNNDLKTNTCTTREAAELLGISVRTAQLWVEDGRLSAWKTPGGHRRILRDSVNAMLADRQRASGDRSDGPFSVLVVEDDPVQRWLMEALISRYLPTCSLRSAADGFEGLMQIGEHAPEVLVTDLSMPGLDGFRMLGSLYRSHMTRSMQIIVVTALSDEEIREHGGLPEGVAVMKKPVNSAELTHLLQAFMSVWAARRSAP